MCGVGDDVCISVVVYGGVVVVGCGMCCGVGGCVGSCVGDADVVVVVCVCKYM